MTVAVTGIDDIRAMMHRVGLATDEARLGLLARFVELLLEANARVNLVSRRQTDTVWRNHVLHSLAPLLLGRLSPDGAYFDLGTGGGLPGLPLAIMLPEATFTLCDSIQKKMREVEGMAHALGLTNVRIAHGRAEELARSPMHRGRHSIVISRAVDDLHVLARWCPPLLAPVPDARLIVWKGGDLSQEIAATRLLPAVRSIETIPLDLPGEPWFVQEQKHLVEVRFEIH